MDFFLQPFWYIEYEKIYTEYYTRLNYFKNHAQINFSEEESKQESYQLNVLHGILNKIRYQYKACFCSSYKDFENLFDFPSNKHKHCFKIPIPTINNDNNDDEIYKINLSFL